MSQLARKTGTIDFEASLEELEDIVNKMEKGDLSLEESLTAFEKGIKLTKDCQKALQTAEQKVNKLVEKEKGIILEPFDSEDIDNE